jgi:hypothetical protein
MLPLPLGVAPEKATSPRPVSAPSTVMDVVEFADRLPLTVPAPRSSAPPLVAVRLPVF